MDDVLKQRLIGAAVLLAGALLLSVLIPDPGTPPQLEPGQQRVTVNLRESTVITTEAEPVAAAPVAEPAPMAEETQPESPPVTEDPPPPAPEPVLKPEALPSPAVPAPAPQTVPQKAAGPALKLDSALSKPPTTAKPAVVSPATTPAAQPAATAEKPWYVQAGSFGEIANARQLLDKLKPAGFPGLISPADTASGARYRVRLGPYPDRSQAEAARAKLAGQGISGAAVTQE